jgi:hypothetical protein
MVARNYRPDHLAVLPDQRGACSLTDGCGVMVNTKHMEIEKKSGPSEMAREVEGATGAKAMTSEMLDDGLHHHFTAGNPQQAATVAAGLLKGKGARVELDHEQSIWSVEAEMGGEEHMFHFLPAATTNRRTPVFETCRLLTNEQRRDAKGRFASGGGSGGSAGKGDEKDRLDKFLKSDSFKSMDAEEKKQYTDYSKKVKSGDRYDKKELGELLDSVEPKGTPTTPLPKGKRTRSPESIAKAKATRQKTKEYNQKAAAESAKREEYERGGGGVRGLFYRMKKSAGEAYDFLFT